MPFPQLAQKLSEAGLTVEAWKEVDSDIIFDPEVTPNRPDWMSVYGIAREIAAITGAKLKNPTPKLEIKKPKNPLTINIKPDYNIVPRKTSVIIRNVKVVPSPDWLQKRIKQIGLRPINNLVDITNYVLWIYGSLLHVFDYDKIRGHQMTIELSKGGEDFRSLDGIDYKLPKNAIVIKDIGRVIDLLPLKGGENTAATNSTKTVLLHCVTCDPILTRRTSQALSLRSDSSTIAERGLDPNGTIVAITHALSLILDLAGGEVASEIIDNKELEFKPWTVEVKHEHIESVLGIKISPTQVKNIYERLGLGVEDEYKVTIPTFRNDIHIEEDLIEEVGRINGYNHFPKNLPTSPVPTTPVAYQRNFDFEYSIKETLKGAGYSEIYSYSLVSENQLLKLDYNPSHALRVDNPISKDFEYLHPTLLGNLLDALKLNLPNQPSIKIFELAKHYLGPTIDKYSENYQLSAVLTGEKFFDAKGDVESLLNSNAVEFKILPVEDKKTAVAFHPGRVADIIINEEIVGRIGEIHPNTLSKFNIKSRVIYWTINYKSLEKHTNPSKKFQPIPKFPSIIEDLSLIIPDKVLYSDVIATISSTSKLVSSIQLLDVHEDSKTLRLTYQDPTKNLTDKEVAQVRDKIIKNLNKLSIKPKI